MFKKLKKQLNRFHDFYFGIKTEEPESTDIIERAKNKEIEPLVEKGERYYFVDGDRKNPFRQKTSMSVIVKDVKDGYVLYAMNNGIFTNESTTVESFLRMYEKELEEK